LLAVFDDDLVNTRFYACWALKKTINATSALETLHEVVTTDPDEDIRSVAQAAIDSIEKYHVSVSF